MSSSTIDAEDVKRIVKKLSWITSKEWDAKRMGNVTYTCKIDGETIEVATFELRYGSIPKCLNDVNTIFLSWMMKNYEGPYAKH